MNDQDLELWEARVILEGIYSPEIKKLFENQRKLRAIREAAEKLARGEEENNEPKN